MVSFREVERAIAGESGIPGDCGVAGVAEVAGANAAPIARRDRTRRCVDALVAAVQRNCHITDARHAADLPLCVFLLQMREFHRWERQAGFATTLDRRALGEWIAAREALWADLEAAEFAAIPVADRRLDPMDAAQINAELRPLGLAYGAGLSSADRPVFFVGELAGERELANGVRLQQCGRELARGLVAPVAALAGNGTIVVRRESFARLLWEKFEAFAVRRPAGPMHSLSRIYGLHDPGEFAAMLPRLVEELLPVPVLHEWGEHRAGATLGPAWSELRLSIGNRSAELRMRAVRDHLADLEVTLPALLEHGAPAPLHFWFSLFDGVRAALCPGLTPGYQAWCGGDGGARLREAMALGSGHFRALAARVVDRHRRDGAAARETITALLAGPAAVCPAPAGA